MEVKLEDLIEKIKKDGVQEAKKESQNILNNAKQEAQDILDNARKEAQTIREQSQNEAERFKTNSQSAMKQASRDVVLGVKGRLIGIFDSVFKAEISGELSADLVKDLIIKITDKWLAKEDSLEITVNEKDKKQLQDLILNKTRKELKNNIEIKVNPEIEKGFRLSLKGENVYYDLTDESILEALKTLLNPALSEILDKTNG